MEGRLHVLIKRLIVVAAIVLLQSCGGSKGGSNAGTPAVSSTSSSSSSVIASTSLKITGLVTADAVSNGSLDFTVGTQHFTTTVNSNNQYQIDLVVSSGNEGAPISVVAQGKEGGSWIKLAALLPSIKKLKTLAGTDNTLDANEFFGVNITSVTTAEYVLAKEYSADIKTDAERTAALLSITSDEETNTVGLLAILLAGVKYKIPSDMATTLDLLTDAQARQSYIAFLQDDSGKFNLFNSVEKNILNDKNQVYVSAKSFEGTYVFESLFIHYVMEFKKDGTGVLHTGSTPTGRVWIENGVASFADVPFLWTQKNKQIAISFLADVQYGKTSYAPTSIFGNTTHFSNQCSQDFIVCDVSLHSILLTQITENDAAQIVQASVETLLKTPTGYTSYSYADDLHYVSLKKAESFYAIKDADLIGGEWYANEYQFIFTGDHKVQQTSLLNNNQKISDWKIQDNRLVIDNGSIEIWFASITEAGFSITQLERRLDAPKDFNAIRSAHLVKRQPVIMTKSDWVGRWSSYSSWPWGSLYDVYSDGQWRDGFRAQSKNNWDVVSATKNTALENGSWRMNRDVLAIHNNHFYISNCGGAEQHDFVPSNCVNQVETKNQVFNGTNFWNVWQSGALFQDQYDTVWDFSDGSGVTFIKSSVATRKELERITKNRFFNKSDKTVFELLSSSIQTIEVCEYAIFSDCSKGKKYTLTRGIELKVPSSLTGGSVAVNQNGLYSQHIRGVIMVPRNTAIKLDLIPDNGYQIGTVIGCDGARNGNYFEIPARNSDCEVFVSFYPL